MMLFINFIILFTGDIIKLYNNSGYIPAGFLHGRASLWIKYYDQYMDLNFFQKFSGWYFTAYASAYAHNDFLRIFAAYGILGFFIYVLIILALLFEIIKTNAGYAKKTGFCILFTFLLFSITTAPTEYSFSIIPIFSFIVYLIKLNNVFSYKI